MVGWISSIAAVVSSLTAVASFCFAVSSRKQAKRSGIEATRASLALNSLEQQRNEFLKNMDERDAVREGAQPWEITQELNSGFRARNKLNVPLYDVDITSDDTQIADKETPLSVVQDGESFTFVAFSHMGGGKRVTISYSLSPRGEKKIFSEPLPPELTRR